jgi:hypothetical protein
MGSSYYIRECCPFVCWRHWFSTILTGPHAGSLSFTSDRFSLGATPRRPRPGPPPGHGAAPTPLRPTAQSHICDGLGPLTRLLKPHHCTSMGLPATPASGDASPAHSPCACGQHPIEAFAINCEKTLTNWVSLLRKTTPPHNVSSSDPRWVGAFKVLDSIITGRQGEYLLQRLAYVQLTRLFASLETIIKSETMDGSTASLTIPTRILL